MVSILRILLQKSFFELSFVHYGPGYKLRWWWSNAYPQTVYPLVLCDWETILDKNGHKCFL